MNASFISQVQFNEIDTCMQYMGVLRSQIDHFNTAAQTDQAHRVARLPIAEMNEGARQAKLWKLKTHSFFFKGIADFVDEVTLTTDYLHTHICALSTRRKARPVTDLRDVLPPPNLVSSYANLPITDCFQLLQHQKEWTWAYAEIVSAASPGFADIRKTVHNVLPRLADYMCFQLQTADAKRMPRLSEALEHQKQVHEHYVEGMSATADFYAQYQRINAMLIRANQRFSEVENSKSLRKLNTHMQLISAELAQVRCYSLEIARLTTAR